MNNTNTQEKELIVRKRMVSFLEKALRFLGYDFRHDEYKQIVYGEIPCKTPFESKIKSMYDAYYYLLSNANSPLSSDIINKFFYILNGEEPDKEMVMRLISMFFYISNKPMLEKAIGYHIFVYNEVKDFCNDQKLIVPLMFFNYVLVRSNIPTLRFVDSTLKKYVSYREKYLRGEKKWLYQLFFEQLKEAKVQERSYYSNLTPLTITDIYRRILEDKELLKEKYGVEHIAIFGSFAKGLARIDSDIDLLVVFSQEISYETKVDNAKRLAEFYFNLFHRYVDVLELSTRVNDWIIKEVIQYKKIF